MLSLRLHLRAQLLHLLPLRLHRCQQLLPLRLHRCLKLLQGRSQNVGCSDLDLVVANKHISRGREDFGGTGAERWMAFARFVTVKN